MALCRQEQNDTKRFSQVVDCLGMVKEMEPLKKYWNGLDDTGQFIILLSTLIPPPIFLDTWIKFSNASPSDVLRIAEKMVSLDLLRVDEKKGVGYYQVMNQRFSAAIMEYAGTERVERAAAQMVSVAEASFSDIPQQWLFVAYLAKITGSRQPDLEVLYRAANYCLNQNQPEDAVSYFKIILEKIPEPETDPEKVLFVKTVVGLTLAKGGQFRLKDQEKILSRGLKAAREIDDPYNLAMILVLLGQVLFNKNEFGAAEKLYDEALENAERIDNEELKMRIVLTTTEFQFFRGDLATAIEQYEKALGNQEELPNEGLLLKARVILGWIYGKCGETARGYGLISAILKKAEELKLEKLSFFARLVTVFTLHDARRFEEADLFVDELLDISGSKIEHFTLWPLYLYKAYKCCLKGEYEESQKLQQIAYGQIQTWGFANNNHPIVFEYLEAFEAAGLHHPEMNYDAEVERAIQCSDIYMQGVGYYYRAKKHFTKGGDERLVYEDLQKSLELSERSGSKLDRSFAQILMGRLLIEEGRKDEAAGFLREAWNVLKFVNESLFPAELRSFLKREYDESYLLEPLIEISDAIGTIRNRQELLNQVVALTMQQTGADRGAFFIYKGSGQTEIIASRNFEPETVLHHSFHPTGKMLAEAIATNRAVVDSPADTRGKSGWKVAFPVLLQKRPLGCFLLECNLGRSRFSEKTLAILKLISVQVAVALDNARAYEEIEELKEKLEAETLFYRSRPAKGEEIPDIIGESPGIMQVISQIHNVAQADTSVLIIGETGVGKELVAKALHRQSKRADGPFIPVNISSLNEGLVTSELFGHEKGAFTNAIKTHCGRFELADKGTLFLDEVNSLSLDIQAKLLRVLEEKRFERVGGSRNIKVNFRLVAACNQALDKLVRKGEFRSDLYYRLNVFPIFIPPLRERKEDIPILISYFTFLYNKKHNKTFSKTPKSTMNRLMEYHWPGNVRELIHLVERAVLTSPGNQLVFPDLSLHEKDFHQKEGFLPYKEMEKNYIKRALEYCNGKVGGPGGAAELIGLKTQTLHSKIRLLGVRKGTRA